MAIAKKTAKRRKTTGAPKRKRKARVGVAAAPKTTVVLSGSKFTKSACGLNKTTASKRADNIRKAGKKARVIKAGSTYCVYTGSKSKALTRRRA